MSVLQVSTYAESIARTVEFYVILPDDASCSVTEGNVHYDRKRKTLYLLHGYSGRTTDWLYGTNIEAIAMKYNLAVVLPSGENSFYLNGKGDGGAYETFTGLELPAYCSRTFGFSGKPEDNIIGGLSMGGFGAIHTALCYPERFGKMFGLSSALVCRYVSQMRPGQRDHIADYDYYTRVFGDLNCLLESENNPEYLISKRLKKGEHIQPIYMACGTDDFLIETNREFRDFLKMNNVSVHYVETQGVHDWKFWNEQIEPAIRWGIDADRAEAENRK